MHRRDLLRTALAATAPSAGFLAGCGTPAATSPASALAAGASTAFVGRVRPGDAAWPTDEAWAALGQRMSGTLRGVSPPFAACAAPDTSAIPTTAAAPLSDACQARLGELGNTWAVGDDPALTETSGWLDAWRSQPPAWVLEARTAADVARAVDFARAHRLRLVVRGGGHSYQGTSDAPDSLLVWTRRMDAVTPLAGFVPAGAPHATSAQPAVRVDAGATWADVYHVVTTQGGRYVQGGGCTSVGVAGFVQGGGFGSFSKRWGTGAANVLELEVVTADGRIRTVNAHQEADLFWALKGGGGGSFGVVTRVVLRTHDLPETFGAVFGRLRAADDATYRALVARTLEWCRTSLVNEHWGEQLRLEGERELGVALVFQGLARAEAEAVVAPFMDWARTHPGIEIVRPLRALAVPARDFWNADAMNARVPGIVTRDPRPGAPSHHTAWTGDLAQVGWFIHAYHSAWLPQALLAPDRQPELVDALMAAKHHWTVELHLNKGLAGAPASALAAARDTATNPQVLDAFALAIIAGGGKPAYPGQPGAGADLDEARRQARIMDHAAAALRRCAPAAGAYVSESDFFQGDWARSFWGEHAARLEQVKAKVDPDGLFIVHHGVGSAGWSDDGFTRRA